MKPDHVLIVYQFRNSDAHKKVKEDLRREHIRFKSINRTAMEKGREEGFDLVITVGGDGTFIRTSHFIRSAVPVLGVNANPQAKVGFFTRAHKNDFRIKLGNLIANQFRIRKLSRLRCIVNGSELPFLALNEFFVSHSITYKLSRYRIFGEFQRSSGVIIGTASGSYAWLKSAGGKMLPLESRKFQYLVREIYDGKDCCAVHRRGILEDDETIDIVSQMRNGIIVVDCLSKPYRLKLNDKVIFRQSPHKLEMISF